MQVKRAVSLLTLPAHRDHEEMFEGFVARGWTYLRTYSMTFASGVTKSFWELGIESVTIWEDGRAIHHYTTEVASEREPDGRRRR